VHRIYRSLQCVLIIVPTCSVPEIKQIETERYKHPGPTHNGAWSACAI